MHSQSFLRTTQDTGSNKPLKLLLAITVVSRIFFALVIWKISGPSGFFGSDTGTYVEPARALLHGSFSSLGGPELFRTPGYPLLLMPAVALGHLVIIALAENFVLAALTAWMIWEIAGSLSPDPKGAFWAVLLYCFEPMGFLHSEKILSETLFTTLFVLFVWILVRFLREPRYAGLALSAVVLGCATYVRPASLYLGLWLVPLLLLFPRALSWRQRACRAILFPVMFMLTLAPWVVRNTKAAGYMGFSSNSAGCLYFYSAAAVQAKLAHRSLSQIQDEWGHVNSDHYFHMHPEQRAWSQARVAQFWGAEAKRIISRHWVLYSLIHARGCAVVLFEPGATEILKVLRLYPEFGGLLSRALDQGFWRAALWLFHEHPIAAVLLPLLLAQLLLYYAFALAGLRRLPLDAKFLFVSLVVYFVLVSGIPAAVARFRVPIMPLVCISAGIGAAEWCMKKHPREAGQSTPAG